ncbi:hypothetical protein CEXT_774491 [Caerostris extrusa]|uniref:Secreted protein n=1 Tax=Caerostris extrusa TaxID=172846 RepID=A0AAV4MN46_CAEEX|nr:hypothetical protein CEXT_774491 [Caerostris extrusa]
MAKTFLHLLTWCRCLFHLSRLSCKGGWQWRHGEGATGRCGRWLRRLDRAEGRSAVTLRGLGSGGGLGDEGGVVLGVEESTATEPSPSNWALGGGQTNLVSGFRTCGVSQKGRRVSRKGWKEDYT